MTQTLQLVAVGILGLSIGALVGVVIAISTLEDVSPFSRELWGPHTHEDEDWYLEPVTTR